MKAFVFSLERMRQYKDQLLNREKDLLARLQQEKKSIEVKIEQLEQYRLLKQKELQQKQQDGMDSKEMGAYQFYMDNTAHLLEQYHKDLAKAGEKVERQLQVVITYSQEINGLDKLEEKQREEYRYKEAKENELQISELVSSKFIREQQSI